jgi:predicted alpha/beta hydrolase family esterase
MDFCSEHGLPFFLIPSYYFAYSWNVGYRDKVVKGAKSKILQLLNESDLLVIVAHSHGNLVVLDALATLKDSELRRIILISQAPAYEGMFFGLLKSQISQKVLSSIAEKLKALVAVRVKGDLLSANPSLDSQCFRCFKGRFFDYGLWGHASVRHRKDVLTYQKKHLEKVL